MQNEIRRRRYTSPHRLPAYASLVVSVALGAISGSCASTPVPSQKPDAPAVTVTQLLPSSASAPIPAPQTPPVPAPAPEQTLLSRSIQEELTGLLLEEPDTQERVRSLAREFMAFKKARPSSATRRQRALKCMGDEPTDAYEASICRLVLRATGDLRRIKNSSSSSKTPKKRLRQLVSLMKSGAYGALATATDREIGDALKKVGDPAALRPLIDEALAAKECPSTTLLTGLGFKMEELFPEAAYKALAQSLYERSSSCGTDARAALAAYRLGLIQVWERKFEAAEATFARIMDNPEAADYRSRVTYWRHFCAKETGNSELRERMKGILAKEYHFSLHGLITVGASDTGNQPNVAFRSRTQPQLNPAARLAEALLAEGGRAPALDVLQPILEQAKNAEPEFQLYLGLLLTRTGDTLNKFRLLAGLFRDYPMLISQQSLELLFPFERFEMVNGYQEQADPYLVLSLIRQESAFNERARSRVGAVGLMQLMPQTARRMERRVSRYKLYEPETNIRLGVRFLTRLSERYQGETEMALAAYNAGPGKVDAWLQRYPVENRLLFVDLIPFRETREYVSSIARNYYWYKRLYFESRESRKGASAPEAAEASDPAKLRLPATEKTPIFKIF